eukprot:g11580.t1 g11580   contig6:148110-149618(+)
MSGRGSGGRGGSSRGSSSGRSISNSGVGPRPSPASSSSTSGGGGRRRGRGDNSKGRGDGGAPSSSASAAGAQPANISGNCRPSSGGRGRQRPSSRPGRGNTSGRTNNSHSSSGPSKAENERLQLERKQRELQEAQAAALLKAQAEQQAEIDRRMALQTQYEVSITGGISVLDGFVEGLKLHESLRGQLDTTAVGSGGGGMSALQSERVEFEKTKKSLKSDLKKCTAFVKKIKSGTFPTPNELSSSSSPIKTLNLSRYVEEVAAAILESGGPNNKMKLAGCTRSGGDGETTCLPRRICLRLLTEFILHGIITDVKPIAKIVAEAAGAPSSSETNSDKEYVVTDANAVVTFAKTGGMEILGVVPRTVRLEYERLQREVEGKGEGGLVVVAADVEGSADAKKEMDLEVPFTAVLSNKLWTRQLR